MSLVLDKFEYKRLPQVTCPTTGKRVYDTPDGNKLPSVTTILDQTSDKSALFEWRRRVGNKEANYITKTSAGIGTLFHKHLEKHILGEERPEGSSYARKHAKIISDVVIENGLKNINEVWGLEIPLYYPGLYAGTADIIGVWNGEPAVMDFKNTRKPKKEEWLDNYFLQLTAYTLAHNKLYETNISKGVIMMVSREEPHIGEYQEFVIDINTWEQEWLKRLEMFYGI